MFSAHPPSLCPPSLPCNSGAFTFKWQDEAHTLGSCALKAATGFTRSYWGEHHSAVIVPQCRVPSCTAYAQGTCKCTACQQGWLPSSGKCVSVSEQPGMPLNRHRLLCPRLRWWWLVCRAAGSAAHALVHVVMHMPAPELHITALPSACPARLPSAAPPALPAGRPRDAVGR